MPEAMPIEVVRYNSELKKEWNAFVRTAKNSTFLFERDYMDYHSDRFTDCSLLFYRGKKLIAMLPANIDCERGILQSHAGLTYGGLILSTDTRCSETLEIFTELKKFMSATLGAKALHYKPLPHIYCTMPAEEPLYALFRMDARIIARSVSTTIETCHPAKPSQLRLRGAKKAAEAGIECSASTDLQGFWNVLTEMLSKEHGCSPVHTIEEIEQLCNKFPENIKLFTARTRDNVIVAGTVVYESDCVAHLQYIAASAEGKKCGALDALIMYLINNIYREKRYIDFGISTEQGGAILNEGLIAQKEGFGGRAVVYETYEMNLFDTTSRQSCE